MKRKRKPNQRIERGVRPPRKRKTENPRRAFMKRRLAEWGRWRRSLYFGPRRVKSWWGTHILARFVGLGDPGGEPRAIDEDVAHDTDAIVKGIDPQLRSILVVQYVLGGDKAEKARASDVSAATYYRALSRAIDAVEIRATILADLSAPPCGVRLDSEKIDIVV